MSIIAYAQLTNAREAAAPGTSSTSSGPGLRTYIDAMAALVPAEVLALHAVVISYTTTSAAAGTAAAILPEGLRTLQVSFWGLLVLAAILYAVPRWLGGRWDRFDLLRLAVVLLSFVGWTMLQRMTAFDAVFPAMASIPRTVTAVFLATVLAAATSGLALVADRKL